MKQASRWAAGRCWTSRSPHRAGKEAIGPAVDVSERLPRPDGGGAGSMRNTMSASSRLISVRSTSKRISSRRVSQSISATWSWTGLAKPSSRPMTGDGVVCGAASSHMALSCASHPWTAASRRCAARTPRPRSAGRCPGAAWQAAPRPQQGLDRPRCGAAHPASSWPCAAAAGRGDGGPGSA